MPVYLITNWWSLLLRSLLSVGFGALILMYPEMGLAVLVLAFGIYMILDGLLAITGALRLSATLPRPQRSASGTVHPTYRGSVVDYRQPTPRTPLWPALVSGTVGIGAGIFTLLWPGVTAVALLLVAATWFVIRGILEVTTAIQIRDEIEGEWWLAFGGIASLVMGILLLAFPLAGIVAFLWLIALFAILSGIIGSMVALRMRRALHHRPGNRRPSYA